MKDIKDYIKNDIKSECAPTSVNIRIRHSEFLKKYNLNLSEMVRDMIDSAMDRMKDKKRA